MTRLGRTKNDMTFCDLKDLNYGQHGFRVVPYENQQIGSWQIGDSKGLKWRTAPSLCAKVYVGTPQFFTTHQLATIVGTRL